ncbi:MAG TPA: cysteine--tRNA ligase, partial [Gaiellaceae bacterium]|nr:cysteine--tRNA ligase [Gaiellaceae bacterium]
MRLYDTLTRSLVELPPPPAEIGMYVCGPTVYQRAHVGNARPFVVFSWLRNWLREEGYGVTFVHNVTDVNDKIYDAAPGRSAVLARRATDWYLEDTEDLGLGMPDEMPLATESIPEIVSLIEELVESGHAYAVDGDVYFRVARFSEYGRLSGQRPGQMEEQEPNPLKEDPRDFALWKANKEGEDTSWDSPWGRGRPGWHIECSAMAEKTLGREFWIHGGGLDLVFPHHENEIAQSQAVGRPFARLWMHNGMLELGGDEMHKSLGNDVSLRNVLDTWGREATLVYFLTGHWHGPIDFSDEVMEQAVARSHGFREVFRNPSQEAPEGAWERFAAALEDDFSTPAALAVMHEWRNHDLLRRALAIFGLESLVEEEQAPDEVVDLAARRHAAREARDFEEADRLRAELEAAGWEARDEADG